MWLPVERAWQLNEHYGALGAEQGGDAEKYGEQQVLIWAPQLRHQPPALETGDPRHRQRGRYQDSTTALPLTECLKDTVDRMLPYWHEKMAPLVKSGRRVRCSPRQHLRRCKEYLDNVRMRRSSIQHPPASPLGTSRRAARRSSTTTWGSRPRRRRGSRRPLRTRKSLTGGALPDSSRAAKRTLKLAQMSDVLVLWVGHAVEPCGCTCCSSGTRNRMRFSVAPQMRQQCRASLS